MRWAVKNDPFNAMAWRITSTNLNGKSHQLLRSWG